MTVFGSTLRSRPVFLLPSSGRPQMDVISEPAQVIGMATIGNPLSRVIGNRHQHAAPFPLLRARLRWGRASPRGRGDRQIAQMPAAPSASFTCSGVDSMIARFTRSRLSVKRRVAEIRFGLGSAVPSLLPASEPTMRLHIGEREKKFWKSALDILKSQA